MSLKRRSCTLLTHPIFSFFFFNDTATTEIYTLSLHDALPICASSSCTRVASAATCSRACSYLSRRRADRKSTRLNSSHQIISYAVFCLKKKKNIWMSQRPQTSDTSSDVSVPLLPVLPSQLIVV